MTKLVENIVKFSLKNSIIVIFFTILLVISGIIAVKNTLIEAYPDVTNSRARIITQWPGRSAEEIERICNAAHYQRDEYDTRKDRCTLHLPIWAVCSNRQFPG